MNKKIIIISSVTVLFLLSAFSVVLYLMSKGQDPVADVVTNTPVVQTEATLEKTKQPEPKKSDTNPVIPADDNLQIAGIGDNFIWLRRVFLGNNADSQKTQNYLKTTINEAGIIVSFCNVLSDMDCAKEFQKIAQSCGISADLQNDPPVAYDNSKNTCFQSYDGITAYLNEEIRVNEEAQRARNNN